jgi:hypothetical protein
MIHYASYYVEIRRKKVGAEFRQTKAQWSNRLINHKHIGDLSEYGVVNVRADMINVLAGYETELPSKKERECFVLRIT